MRRLLSTGPMSPTRRTVPERGPGAGPERELGAGPKRGPGAMPKQGLGAVPERI